MGWTPLADTADRRPCLCLSVFWMEFYTYAGLGLLVITIPPTYGHGSARHSEILSRWFYAAAESADYGVKGTVEVGGEEMEGHEVKPIPNFRYLRIRSWSSGAVFLTKPHVVRHFYFSTTFCYGRNLALGTHYLPTDLRVNSRACHRRFRQSLKDYSAVLTPPSPRFKMRLRNPLKYLSYCSVQIGATAMYRVVQKVIHYQNI